MSNERNELIVQEHFVNGIRAKVFPHPSGFQIAALVSDIDPETAAALGASLSRNPASLLSRLKNLSAEMRDRILGVFFKGYGHSSVGEMGHLFLTVEGVSMLGAMLSIFFPLFKGQEASTRYIDFRDAEYMLPERIRNSKPVRGIVGTWFTLYKEITDYLTDHFEKQGVAEREIKPMVCDITGAFLPIAAKTSAVITSEIRNIIEHAWELQTYGGEMKLIGDHLLAVVDHLCPNSVNLHEVPERMQYRSWVRGKMEQEMYAEMALSNLFRKGEPRITTRNLNTHGLRNFLKGEPPERFVDILNAEEIGRYGSITASAEISYRSLRDLFRHRPQTKLWSPRAMVGAGMVNGGASAGVLNFAPWYLEQMPDEFCETVSKKITPILTESGCWRCSVSKMHW